MTLPPPSRLRDWYGSREAFFDRASEDVGQAVTRFLQDWALESGVRVVSTPIARVKSAERIWAKLQRKESISPELDIHSFDELLAQESLVGDMVGVRFVVRGLSDLSSLQVLMEENGFLDYDPFTLMSMDDKNAHPSPTGYRALHVNVCVRVSIRDEVLNVPAEVQVKTGLQDSWGTFTHDTAYERLDLHDDPQFKRLRELQRLLADSLDVADQLNRSVEEIYADFVETRAGSAGVAGTDPLTLDGVLSVLHEAVGSVVSFVDARRILDTARFCGIGQVGQLQSVVGQEVLQSTAADAEILDGVRPPLVDVVIDAIESRHGFEDENASES